MIDSLFIIVNPGKELVNKKGTKNGKFGFSGKIRILFFLGPNHVDLDPFLQLEAKAFGFILYLLLNTVYLIHRSIQFLEAEFLVS